MNTFSSHAGRSLLKTLAAGWLASLLGAAGASAQFATGWLQNEAYWGDGKAEFDIYEAQQVRYGEPRPSEVIHIWVREPFSLRETVKAEANSTAGTYPVIKLNQILHIPTGLYVYQQMHSSFWRVNDGTLIKATLTSNDSCGNSYKEFRAVTDIAAFFGHGWIYEWRTYWEGMAAGKETLRAPKDAVFYDELPMRVRSIDFSVPGVKGGFDVALAASIIRSKKDIVKFEPARVEWSREPEAIRVTVSAGKAVDEFVLDPAPPYLLREWKQADGSHLKLQRSVKIDYWNYNKLGDKERALRGE